MAPCEGLISARNVLWSMIFTGCGINYMVRTNLNIALVAMVKTFGSGKNNTVDYQNISIESGNVTNSTGINTHSQGEYDWNEYEQTLALGAFFWTYWIAQVPSGVLTQKYGTKLVFGFSNLFLCVTNFLIPLSANMHVLVLVALRTLQGLVGGLAWPSLHGMTAKWIPPNERSKFITSYMGSSVGSALTYPLCGLIIHSFGWRAVFYVSGTVGVLWVALWWKLVFDTPAEHPRISQKELHYIQSSLTETVTEKKLPTPWFKLLTSGPLWITIAAHWGCIWIFFTLLTQGPTYFQTIHNCSIRVTGLLSGIPHITRILLGLGSSYLCDWMLDRNFSFNTVRKVAVTLSSTLQGVFVVGLAFCGTNTLGAIACYTTATALSGAEAPAALASYCDLAPNFASVVMGLGNMITVISGFISPIVVGVITYQNQTVEGWQLVYLISGAMAIIPGLIYLCIGTSTVQPWNDPVNSMKKDLKDSDLKQNHEELQRLQA